MAYDIMVAEAPKQGVKIEHRTPVHLKSSILAGQTDSAGNAFPQFLGGLGLALASWRKRRLPKIFRVSGKLSPNACLRRQ